jgi:isopenicillin N synthase-like dioxygenase
MIRYPGLHVWQRNSGKRIAVRFPAPGEPGHGHHLLVQAGKQLEHLTGGLVRAGFHEVVVNEATVAAIEARRPSGRPLVRISSTFFWHLSSDYDLAPISSLAERAKYLTADRRNLGHEEEEAVYEPMKVGLQVQK